METQTSFTLLLVFSKGIHYSISVHNLLRLNSNIDRSKGRKGLYTKKNQEADDTQQKTITDADYADDIALPANTPAHAESLLQSLEQAAGGISLHVNADKTENMYFNQKGEISTLNRSSLKWMHKFTHLGS